MDQMPTPTTSPAAPDPAALPVPEVTDLPTVQRRSAYQALQPVVRPPYWGVDLDPRRRPGTPMMRPPRPWPNTSYPPERQAGEPAVPLHGRPNRTMPPVFSTAMPLRGLSGVVRRLAYRLPDHYPSHWLLKLLGDRVDAWGHRARRYLPVLLPLAAIAVFVSRRRS